MYELTPSEDVLILKIQVLSNFILEFNTENRHNKATWDVCKISLKLNPNDITILKIKDDYFAFVYKLT